MKVGTPVRFFPNRISLQRIDFEVEKDWWRELGLHFFIVVWEHAQRCEFREGLGEGERVCSVGAGCLGKGHVGSLGDAGLG